MNLELRRLVDLLKAKGTISEAEAKTIQAQTPGNVGATEATPGTPADAPGA